jgi:hypothetical protein
VCKYLTENKLFNFWVDVNGKFSNKIHTGLVGFERIIKENPEKFVGKTFCRFNGACYYGT